jgi:hypothetical protein
MTALALRSLVNAQRYIWRLLREEFAQRYEHDKTVMVEALDRMVTEGLQSEIQGLAEEKRLKLEFEKKQAEYIAQQKKLNDDLVKERIKIRQVQEKELANQFNSIGNNQKVVRIFQISNFGIYNSDCPNSLPIGETLNPIYLVNQNTPLLNVTSTYLICNNRNLVYNLNPKEPLRFNPNERYSLCIIANGKTYLCNAETFSKTTSNKQSKINLSELSSEIDNVFDFKKALGI